MAPKSLPLVSSIEALKSEDPQRDGLGLDGIGDLLSPAIVTFDSNTLSPFRERSLAYQSSPSSPAFPLSPTSLNAQDGSSPFNFQPMSLAKSAVTKSVRAIALLEDSF